LTQHSKPLIIFAYRGCANLNYLKRGFSMKRNISVLFLLGVLLVAYTCPLSAGIKANSQNLAPTFGAMYWDLTDEGLPVEARSPYLGARYSVFFHERVGVEGSFGILPSANSEDTRSYNFMKFGGNVIFNLATGNVIPYAVGGVGLMKNWVQEEYLDINDPYYEFGGGIKYYPGDDTWVGIDVRDVLMPLELDGGESKNYQNILATFSFGFQWGGGPPPDTDMDGVPDKKDKCPGTPMGAVVDERGCPVDTDGDGVYDGLDKCTGTPAGARVDKSGCPMDSDGDGVFDGIDKCASTPSGAVVDATGCPLDGDGDGVYDGLDKCPDTAAGAKIDFYGCEIKVIEYEFLSKKKVELRVQFETGSATIAEESKAGLDEIGDILVKWEKVNVEIGGHTDSSGSDTGNLKLSQKRAESVRDYLLEHHASIDSGRLLAKGYGESEPVADNDTKEGRQQNRRVEIKVLNPDTLKQALPE